MPLGSEIKNTLINLYDRYPIDIEYPTDAYST